MARCWPAIISLLAQAAIVVAESSTAREPGAGAGLGLLVLALDAGESLDETDLLGGEHIGGIACFLPLSLLGDRSQQIEVALGAKLLQTAFPLPHGAETDRPRLPDITHGEAHLSRDAIEADAGNRLASPSLLSTAFGVPQADHHLGGYGHGMAKNGPGRSLHRGSGRALDGFSR
jgi:hypothetical protein